MSIRPLSLFAATLLWLAAPAHAVTIATGLISKLVPESGVTSARVICAIANVSTKPVTVNFVSLVDTFDQSIGNTTPTGCSYPQQILPGKSCVHVAAVSDLVASSGGQIRCQVDVKGSAKSLRVTILGETVSASGVGAEVSQGE
jgi:hypothetical protein